MNEYMEKLDEKSGDLKAPGFCKKIRFLEFALVQ